MQRGGKKKKPFYRIVAADSRAPRDGRFIERLGSYDPLLAENKVTVDAERVSYWLNVGALPTERVIRLLKLQGMEHKALVLPMHEALPSKAELEAKAAQVAGEAKAAADAQAAVEAKAAEKAAAQAAQAEAASAAEAAPAE